VLAPLAALVSVFLVVPLPRRWQPWVALGVTALFVAGDWPWFWSNATPDWFGPG
jgi:hypothetical protein